MHIPRLLLAPFFSLMICAPMISHAQSLTSEEKTAAIQNISKLIAANYVSAEKGGQIASHILTANFQGAFAKASTWETFDEMVTASLRKFSGDEHLYVRRDAAQVKKLKYPASDADSGMMQTGTSSPDDNYGFRETKVLDGNVGYLKLSSINISEKSLPLLYTAMRTVENTDALIIDLRDNGGGGSEKGAVLESYFLNPSTPLLNFTTRDGVTRTDSTVSWLAEKKYTKPVYIIINKNTASAAEAFAFTLQMNKRAKIIGETSAGAANMNEWFVVNDENYVSVSTSSPTLPGTDLTWEQRGVRPDFKVKNGDPLLYTLNKIAGKQ